MLQFDHFGRQDLLFTRNLSFLGLLGKAAVFQQRGFGSKLYRSTFMTQSLNAKVGDYLTRSGNQRNIGDGIFAFKVIKCLFK